VQPSSASTSQDLQKPLLLDKEHIHAHDAKAKSLREAKEKVDKRLARS
jgi:hypothetical protein